MKGIGWSGSMCTAWIFTATHFAAHRKAFAFHSSTPVSGVSGNFDNSSPNKDRAARWLERATVLLSRWPDFRRKLVDHLENSPFKRRELPPNHHCQSFVGPVNYTVYFYGTHLTSLVSPNEWWHTNVLSLLVCYLTPSALSFCHGILGAACLTYATYAT